MLKGSDRGDSLPLVQQKRYQAFLRSLENTSVVNNIGAFNKQNYFYSYFYQVPCIRYHEDATMEKKHIFSSHHKVHPYNNKSIHFFMAALFGGKLCKSHNSLNVFFGQSEHSCCLAP